MTNIKAGDWVIYRGPSPIWSEILKVKELTECIFIDRGEEVFGYVFSASGESRKYHYSCEQTEKLEPYPDCDVVKKGDLCVALGNLYGAKCDVKAGSIIRIDNQYMISHDKVAPLPADIDFIPDYILTSRGFEKNHKHDGKTFVIEQRTQFTPDRKGIEHFREEIFTALEIPRELLGKEKTCECPHPEWIGTYILSDVSGRSCTEIQWNGVCYCGIKISSNDIPSNFSYPIDWSGPKDHWVKQQEWKPKAKRINIGWNPYDL
jgi:hypothetical protein